MLFYREYNFFNLLVLTSSFKDLENKIKLKKKENKRKSKHGNNDRKSQRKEGKNLNHRHTMAKQEE